MPLQGLLGISRLIDAFNARVGKIVAWCVFVAVVVSTGNAIVRYTFNTSSNAWLELQWYLFGAVFMLCASWTLKEQEHIRIDILSNALGPKFRSGMDLFGHLFFLLPFTILMVLDCWPFFMRSFISGEISASAGGLIVWPAKLLILLGFVMLTAQGISETIKRLAVMSGHLPEFLKGGHHGSEPEAKEHAA